MRVVMFNSIADTMSQSSQGHVPQRRALPSVRKYLLLKLSSSLRNFARCRLVPILRYSRADSAKPLLLNVSGIFTERNSGGNFRDTVVAHSGKLTVKRCRLLPEALRKLEIGL